MKEIKAYKTSDARIFDNEEEAISHQVSLDTRERLSDFYDKYFFSSMTREDIVDIIMENLTEFKSIL